MHKPMGVAFKSSFTNFIYKTRQDYQTKLDYLLSEYILIYIQLKFLCLYIKIKAASKVNKQTVARKLRNKKKDHGKNTSP
jgi:hypothetical protein